jgi:uncharacterized protein DUF3108
LRKLNTIAWLLLAAIATLGFQTKPPAPSGSPPAAPGVPNQNSAGPGVADSKINLPISTYRFPDGFTFTYSVDWRLVTAGQATLRLDNVNGEHHVVVNADSTGAVALLYHVHDRLETFYNPQTNCALSLTKHTEEGFRRVETKVRYDYSRKKAVVDEQNLRAKNQKHEENDIGSCASNTLAAVYYVASQPLQAGAKFTFPSSDGGKATDIEVTVEARESVKTPAGSFNTIRVAGEALNGPQKGKGKIWMWYSDDERRIPVQMRARAFWGTMTFRLTQMRPSTS